MSHLSDLFEQRCSKIRERTAQATGSAPSMRDEWHELGFVAHFLGHDDYLFIANGSELDSVRAIERTASSASFYSESTINDGIALAIYKAMEAMSHLGSDFYSYQTVLELLHGLLIEAERGVGYTVAFENRMWRQIAVNVAHRWYPVPVRAYLQFIGFALVAHTQQKPWITDQTERVRRLLYVDLRPLLDRDEKMINGTRMQEAFLPEMMSYGSGLFTYTSRFGEGDTTEIAPPDWGSLRARSH